ncbi:hypothetical protein [Melittangium boletus]|uniref:hypothetical protein n=1 Tax=Melittangium boletus TaxID=83453 RepID=UPI003DA3B6B3
MRSLLFSLLLCFVPLCPAFAAEDSTWGTTFTTDAVASWLDRPSARYLVVVPGPPSPALGEAERALTAALRASGKASLVMDAQALGPVASLDDASIVQRASHFPMDRILVLRLFPDASGALTQAMAVLYDPVGASRGAFSATRGTPLVANPTPDAPKGAEPKVAEVPAKPLLPAPRPGLSPEEQYEQSYIGFDDFVAVSTGSMSLARRFTVPFEGKFKKPLEGKSFYEKVGRQDLVESYDKKMNIKVLLGVAGGASILGGFIYAFSTNSAPREDCQLGPDFSACIDRGMAQTSNQISSVGTAIGISAVGVALLSTGIFINAHPVSPSEARELADTYNTQLKSELGLSDERPSTPPPRSVGLQARLSAQLGADGGRLLLSGSF